MLSLTEDTYIHILPLMVNTEHQILSLSNKHLHNVIQKYYCHKLKSALNIDVRYYDFPELKILLNEYLLNTKMLANNYPVEDLNRNNNNIMSIYMNVIINKRPPSWLYSVDNEDFNNYAIDTKVDPSMDDNYAIRRAIKYKRFGQVELLLKDERVTSRHCFTMCVGNIFIESCIHNQINLVKKLLDIYDFSICTLVGALEQAHEHNGIRELLTKQRKIINYMSIPYCGSASDECCENLCHGKNSNTS